MKIRRLPIFLSAATFVYIFDSCCGGVHAQHVHVEEQKVIEENNAKLLSLDLGDERGDSYALPSLRGRRRRNLSIEGTVTATITNSTSNDETIADGIDFKESVGRQIILLAGPHKTASTTMQVIASKLANTKGYTQNGNWKWIDPFSPNIKNFSLRLMRPLTAYHTRKQQTTVEKQTSYRKHAVDAINVYKNRIEKEWNSSNHNLILGGEKVDMIVDDDVTMGDDILDDVLSILPDNYKDVTTVLINYRAPRLDHLISVWKQCSMQVQNCDGRFTHLTFAEFMGDPDAAPLVMRHIDSLQMTKKFLDRGLKVSLLDIGGLANDEKHMYQYLACEIMKEPCNAESGLPLAMIDLSNDNKGTDTEANSGGDSGDGDYAISSLKIRANENKTDWSKVNLDHTKLNAMEQILKRYDCNFRDNILNHEKLTVAHSHLFETNMDECISTASSSETRQYFDREAVMKSLRQIVCGKDECEEAHAAVTWKKEKLAQKSGIRYVPKLTSKSGQQIVLMVGPHKAGSTSMQTIALKLTSNPALLSKKWNWIAPPIGPKSAKSFAVLPVAIRFAGGHKGVHPVMSSKEAIQVFSAEIAKQWHDSSSNTNLIMGSEEIDSLNDAQIGELLSVMPPDYESAMTVVVTYRSPRLAQLVSIWKQITQNREAFHSLSFKDFILDNQFNNIHAMDTMRLVKTFLDRKEGFDVVLIDLAGMKEKGLHMYQVIACDLMGEPCDSNTMDPDKIANKPRIIEDLTKNQSKRSIEGDVGATAEQLREISDVLMAYDCGFQDLLLKMNGNGNKSGRLTVLYDDIFTQNMNRCSDLPEPLDADATVAKLKAILLDLPVVS